MLVTLIGKNSVNKITLPQNVVGSYWLTDKNTGKHLLNIEGENGNWQITSNNLARVIAGSWKQAGEYEIKATKPEEETIEKITLKEYSMYYVCIGKGNNVYILYCTPVYEEEFVKVNIKNNAKEILIGKTPENQISYKLAVIEKVHASLTFADDKWTLKNYDKKYGTFVNSEPITSKEIGNGDVIFIMGLKIIVMGKNLFINNPLDKVHYDSHTFNLIERQDNVLELKPETDTELETYEEEEYFSRAPRLTNVIEHAQVKVDSPPQKQNSEQMPMIFMMLPMLAMGMMSMVMLFTSIQGVIAGTARLASAIPQILMGVGMLFGMLFVPILTRSYQKRKAKRYEEKRQNKYSEYIDSKSDLIDEIMDTQRRILLTNYLTADQCQELAITKDRRLWERKIEEHDFLTIKVGNGDIPLDATIKYPEADFVMDEDNLMELVKEFGNKSKILRNVPITLSLTEKNISALMVQRNKTPIEEYVRALIMQLITFHSPEDLKLVFLISDNKQKQWDYVKKLPHIWNDAKEMRFFADNYQDMQKISKYLGEDLQSRIPDDKNRRESDYKSFSPYYLIITDDYKKVENLKIMSDVLKSKTNVGFSVLFISSSLMQLPNECKTFVKLEDDIGTIFESEGFTQNQKQFIMDTNKLINFDEAVHTVANIPIKYTSRKFYFTTALHFYGNV